MCTVATVPAYELLRSTVAHHSEQFYDLIVSSEVTEIYAWKSFLPNEILSIPKITCEDCKNYCRVHFPHLKVLKYALLHTDNGGRNSLVIDHRSQRKSK